MDRLPDQFNRPQLTSSLRGRRNLSVDGVPIVLSRERWGRAGSLSLDRRQSGQLW